MPAIASSTVSQAANCLNIASSSKWPSASSAREASRGSRNAAFPPGRVVAEANVCVKRCPPRRTGEGACEVTRRQHIDDPNEAGSTWAAQELTGKYLAVE